MPPTTIDFEVSRVSSASGTTRASASSAADARAVALQPPQGRRSHPATRITASPNASIDTIGPA